MNIKQNNLKYCFSIYNVTGVIRMERKTLLRSYDSSISTVKVEVCFIIETMHEIEQSQY